MGLAEPPRRRLTEKQRQFHDFFGLRKGIVALLSMVILVGLGEKMAERFARQVQEGIVHKNYSAGRAVQSVLSPKQCCGPVSERGPPKR